MSPVSAPATYLRFASRPVHRFLFGLGVHGSEPQEQLHLGRRLLLVLLGGQGDASAEVVLVALMDDPRRGFVVGVVGASPPPLQAEEGTGGVLGSSDASAEVNPATSPTRVATAD